MRAYYFISSAFILQIFAFANASAGLMELECNTQENVFSPPSVSQKEISNFASAFPKVNVITGEYCEEECDLIVTGIEPLSFRRFYEHLGYKDQVYGHWRVNPECFMLYNFELSNSFHPDYKKFVGIGEVNGSFYNYEKNEGTRFCIDYSLLKGPTNKGKACGGQSHPLNVHIDFQKHQAHQKKEFSYSGTIIDGSGRLRIFGTETRLRPTDKYHKEVSHHGETTRPFGPFPPYQAFIKEEIKPNGNILEYEYVDYNQLNYLQIYVDVPEYYILKSITAYNSTKSILLGKLEIDYSLEPCSSRKDSHRTKRIEICGSDGRKATLLNGIRHPKPKRDCSDVVLLQVDSAFKPQQNYNYHWKEKKRYFDSNFLMDISHPEGRSFVTHYDMNAKKVSEQLAPVGFNGEMAPIARYIYQADRTVVYDGENNKTVYCFNSDYRITAIEKYLGESLFSIEKNSWDLSTGNLIRKTIENPKGEILLFTNYDYDSHQNVILETSNADAIHRNFSDDGFNLKIYESDREGKEVHYSYVPGTNLLSSEITSDRGQIQKRIFHFYDDKISSVRVRTITDDGKNTNFEDLTGVTYRHITEITPKYTLPCVGFPQEIREKTIDDLGREILLKRICYQYHPSGKITQEDHYDSNNTFCYSIVNEYDTHERLISVTDELGYQTHFEYDANFNLVSQIGPKERTRKEWVYDLVNRPIQEKEWQDDGSILITQKKYDKASRLIATIDECGFQTQYEYDSLGRVIAIIYPDGCIIRNEYDALGNLTKETDGNGYVTCKEYNFRGQPTAIYHPNGSEEHFTYYDRGGMLASHVDVNGVKTVYTYDIFDHPVKTETFSSEGILLKVVSAVYSPFNKLSETDAEGITTTYSYDQAGRKVSEKKAGKRIRYTYDSLGRVAKTQDGEATYCQEYDFKGQVLEERTEDEFGNTTQIERYAYDELGHQVKIINSKGATEKIYNSRGLLCMVKDALGHTTCINYSYNGGFTKTEIDPKERSTIHCYDARGNEYKTVKKNAQGEEIQHVERRFDGNRNLVEEAHTIFDGTTFLKTLSYAWRYGPGNRVESLIEGELKETKYIYDEKGRLCVKIKPDETWLHHRYDAMGRLSDYFSDDFHYQYSYDKNDQVLSVSDGTHRRYDALGNVTEEILGNGLQLSYKFDNQGKCIQTILPDASSIEYSYYADRLHQVSRNRHIHTYSERDLEGRLIKAVLPDGLGLIQIERDALSRWKAFHSPFYSSIFESDAYDSIGNLSHYQFIDSLGCESCTYSYDDLNQLISENEHCYQFDSLHNRLKKDGFDYQVNLLNQITDDGQKEYIYDANGNLIADGKHTFVYDSLDRLIRVDQDTSSIQFTYDSFNRRLSKTVFAFGKQVHKQRYIYDGNNEIGSCDEAGAIKELRVLGEGCGAEIGGAVLFELYGKSYVPIHDHRGSVVTVIDLIAKKPHETYRYTAFGEELTHGKYSPWRFASKRVDPETGWVYFGRRYYSPDLGRWITPDPQGFEDGPNLYAYVHNGPMTAFDFYGLWTWNDAWSGMSDFLDGAASSIFEMGVGIGSFAGMMGEWMYADFQYEYANDSSLFALKSERGLDTWKGVGQFAQAACENPLLALKACGEVFIPGVMEVWQDPTSARAWGAAAVDVGLALSVFGNVGRGEKVLAGVGNLSREASTASKCVGVANQISKVESIRDSSRILISSSKQLQAKFKHASDFEVTGSYCKANATKYSAKINQHINNPNVQTIQGTYRGNSVIHYFDHQTGLNVISSSSGEFISCWKLNSAQFENIAKHGRL